MSIVPYSNRINQGLVDSTRRRHATSIVTAKFNKCVGGAKWKSFSSSSPVNATLVLVGVLGRVFLA